MEAFLHDFARPDRVNKIWPGNDSTEQHATVGLHQKGGFMSNDPGKKQGGSSKSKGQKSGEQGGHSGQKGQDKKERQEESTNR
jgi:hypothetical protein